MQPDTITQKLYARADAKLQAFCEERFGDLFKLCGGLHAGDRPKIEEFPQLQAAMNQCKITDKDCPWHGSVWSLAKATFFAVNRDKWREREVNEFMKQVENMQQQFEELTQY